MSEDRYGMRRVLFYRFVTLQMQAQCGDTKARALLEEARDALQAFDAESLRLFNREVSGGREATHRRRGRDKRERLKPPRPRWRG